MDGHADFRECRELTLQASFALGTQWTALIAGCSLSTIQSWQRRSRGQVFQRTAQRCLPRLRSWSDWVIGYLTTRAEIGAMQDDEHLTVSNLLAELGTLLHSDAAGRYSPMELAYGCEVHPHWLKQWASGSAGADQRPDLIRAVVHLRRLHRWPTPKSPLETEVAARGGD